MLDVIALSNTLDALIPITRFNRGEASKVFDEVRKSGCKIVVKNNTPACVLLTPEKYQEMVSIIEDQCLLALAKDRELRDTGETYSLEELLAKDGLSIEDIDAMEDVEIE